MANDIKKIWELMGVDSTTGTGTYKNRMGLSNTITRDYGIPLDLSSLHEKFEDAVVYAATSSVAYVGQILTVGEKAYIITQEPQGVAKISTYRNSLTGKIVDGAAQEYNIYIKPITSDDEKIEYVEGEGIDITDTADGQRVISLGRGGVTNEHISSVSADKIYQEEGTVLVLNGGKA